jgi:hypothetical protein
MTNIFRMTNNFQEVQFNMRGYQAHPSQLICGTAMLESQATMK